MSSSVEEMLKQLEKRINVLEDAGKIRNLMARYQAYESAGEGRRVMEELWTRHKPDPTHEYGAGGVYRGLDEIAPFYCNEKQAGVWQFHTLTAPDIEIGDDGCRAEGTWVGIGIELDAGECSGSDLSEQPNRIRLLSSKNRQGKRYSAEWVIRSYHVVFTKEEDCWKIWHMHIWEPARCPFDQDWVSFSKARFDTDGIRLDERYKTYEACAPGKKPENLAFWPTTGHWQYIADEIPEPWGGLTDSK